MNKSNGEQDWGRVAPDIAPTGGGASFASQPPLDAKSPVGNGQQTTVYHNGVSSIAGVMNADTTNSTTDLNIGYDQTNRAAKYKYPGKSQDVPSASRTARPNSSI